MRSLALNSFSQNNNCAPRIQRAGGKSTPPMRLTHIKLAGFKSFVDPTSINVPGKLVGVVGPNGCGKSNIIDAVRWVLGESRASALRGESMQDVIFNGSLQRSPVARASVELMFDNSLGKAAGQWSRYAEISVRRVLDRSGESSYFINGTHVRRRDIQDIFMGTGLGPRAYAIIEQGMISRIIEAKPEDLRIFLEEAAGISKYKDRRRETEHRLSDTRENLARVDDIRQELGSQIEKLENQADVARRFNELNKERTGKQNILWLIRKLDSQSEASRHAREIEQSSLQLEADTARLRETERVLEETRVEHYTAGDAANAAQGDLYQANSEVARLEAEIRHIADTRTRLDQQRSQLVAQASDTQRQSEELQEAEELWAARAEEARARIESVQASHEEEVAKLPVVELEYKDAQSDLQRQREAVSRIEQARSLEQAHVSHSEKTLFSLTTRRERLEAEHAALPPDANEELDHARTLISDTREELSAKVDLLSEAEESRGKLSAARGAAQSAVQATERELSALSAKLSTLAGIQEKSGDNDSIHGWLETNGLLQNPRLWQRISVDAGWETAFESALRECLHALEVASDVDIDRLAMSPPPVRAAAYADSESFEMRDVPGFRPLCEFAHPKDEPTENALRGWLAGFYAAESSPSVADRRSLPYGGVLVTRDGHQFSRSGVRFFSPDADESGVLARQREIDSLVLKITELEQEAAITSENLRAAEARVDENDSTLTDLRALVASIRQSLHEIELNEVRLRQAKSRRDERVHSIENEMAELEIQASHERDSKDSSEERLSELILELERARDALAIGGSLYTSAESLLSAQRNVITQADRAVQAAVFQMRECEVKLEEIGRSLRTARDQQASAISRIATIDDELSTLLDSELKASLQNALEVRVACERSVAEARAKHEGIGELLRSCEAERLSIEHRLQPLRDKLADLRLKEQAARLAFEQFSSQLLEAEADETLVASEIKDGQRPGPLQGEITRLANAVAELGPINMAALDELTASQERKAYLDAQSSDLAQALETLESAIRKIDRETRELLKTTFDAVNSQFAQMFPALFGGGEARLEITGEEILDCGVQVIARPPGKKNSTIHLLSGGEKALTAISLVFSMFQLNPAPFCLLDEVDAPLDDANTGRFCDLVSKMSQQTQFLYISHNKITMEMASHLVGVTMQEQGVSRVVAVDMEQALQLREPLAA